MNELMNEEDTDTCQRRTSSQLVVMGLAWILHMEGTFLLAS